MNVRLFSQRQTKSLSFRISFLDDCWQNTDAIWFSWLSSSATRFFDSTIFVNKGYNVTFFVFWWCNSCAHICLIIMSRSKSDNSVIFQHFWSQFVDEHRHESLRQTLLCANHSKTNHAINQHELHTSIAVPTLC